MPKLGKSAIAAHFKQISTDVESHGIVEKPERLEAVIPPESVELGRPLEVPLKLASDDVTQIWVQMSDAKGVISSKSRGADIGSGIAKVVGERPNEKTIEVIPLQEKSP
jgi:hypothetical protein